MPVSRFGAWLPDQPALGNPGILTALNLYPAANGYLPVPQWQAQTDALDARARGAIRLRDNDGVARSFSGDAGKLYQLSGASWGDVSKSGGYSTADEEAWEFAQFDQLLIATNFSDEIQQFDLAGDTEFSDLTTDFQARHIATLRDFVVAGNTFDAGDGAVRNRLRWCAFGDPGDWTPDPATLADFSDLRTGGEIMRIVGGEFAVIFQRSSIRRMTFVGAPVVFQLDEVLPNVGIFAPGSVVQDGRTIYFLSTRGFLSLTDGVGVAPIGAQQVDGFVLKDLDVDFAHRITSEIDPKSGRVFFAYPGTGHVNGTPNRILVYDINLKRWALIEEPVELLWGSGGVAIDLDTNDASNPDDAILDDVDISLDSSRYKGGGQLLGVFNSAHRSGAFDGDDMKPATIVTAEEDAADGHRSRLKAFRALIDGGAVTARIGERNDLEEEAVFGPAFSRTSTGRFTRRSNARYRRLRFDISGAMKVAVGVQYGAGDLRRASRR